ncbi:MAG: hypothetical protein GY730_01760 [bacterium]|nr:hypothetical protein [bacterium]
MTNPNDSLEVIPKIVLTTDICSSSQIMEDLLRTESISFWRDVLIELKNFLAKYSANVGSLDLYKFTGDGWILLFSKGFDGVEIMTVIYEINEFFNSLFDSNISNKLDKPPKIKGLTFGMDSGPLIKFEMMEKFEYVGRAINLACRLQSAISEEDIHSGYRLIVSNPLYESVFSKEREKFKNLYPEGIMRSLKNIIGGDDLKCYRFAIEEVPFKILEARYGTDNSDLDVKSELISQIKYEKIDITVGNDVFKGDPDPGSIKSFYVKYINNGQNYEKNAKEGARIQLP